ncbi:unnamed protein product [Prorocentrum cordatum]|uniref:Uncharacterized protein n=1 Tax=Prorocentrum cordatum TaxID=2364126 RepID=A0ABN9W9A6_9DINO|nr:unnamed protein product [Polarella glacialis]
MSCAEALIPAGEHAKVTYLDDEGDACTLLEQSVLDALCMASSGDGDQATVSPRRAQTWISERFVQLDSGDVARRRRPVCSFADGASLEHSRVLLLCVQGGGSRHSAEAVSESSGACADAAAAPADLRAVEESKLRARADMRAHLAAFLGGRPRARFEEWIADYHPDNVVPPGRDSRGLPTIDRRLYHEGGDHRAIWSEHARDDGPAPEAEAGAQGAASPREPTAAEPEAAGAAPAEPGRAAPEEEQRSLWDACRVGGLKRAAQLVGAKPMHIGCALSSLLAGAAEHASGAASWETSAALPSGASRAPPSTKEQHSFLDVCKLGDFKKAKKLIDAKPELINAQPERRWSALHHFAQRGHEEAVRYLIDRGADLSALNVDGATPPEVADDSVLHLFIAGHDGGIVLGPAPVVVEAEPAAESGPAKAPSAVGLSPSRRRRSSQEDSLHGEAVAGAMASTAVTSCLEDLGAENARLEESSPSLAAEASRVQESAEASLRDAAREQRRLERELEETLSRNAALLAERDGLRASLQQARQQLRAQSSQADGLQHQLATAAASVRAAAPADEGPSASVVSCELVVGVEVRESEGGCGDATEELGELVFASGARSAFRLGSVGLATVPLGAGAEAEAPVCAQVRVLNDGATEWPATAAVVCLSGPGLGAPLSAVGPLAAGEATDVTLDLALPPRSEPLESRSVWALVDAASGRPLGPLLVLDAAWRAEAA